MKDRQPAERRRIEAAKIGRNVSGSVARRRTGDADEVSSMSGVFAPPLRPFDLVGGTRGLHDGPLIRGTESPIEAGQRGLDKPRFEGHPCGLAVGIEFLGHSGSRSRSMPM